MTDLYYFTRLFSVSDKYRKVLCDAPKVVANPDYKIPPVDRVPALREFNVNGHTIMARNRKDAIKTAVRKGIVSDKKKKRK